jgi:hypothetical protein
LLQGRLKFLSKVAHDDAKKLKMLFEGLKRDEILILY